MSGEDDMVPGQEGVEGTGVNETIKRVSAAKLRRTQGDASLERG